MGMEFSASDFKKMERTEADGGDVTQGNHDPALTSYSEYNRTQGSDGFSQTGGKGNGLGK